jgi:trk system potassium uptake protein TrkA
MDRQSYAVIGLGKFGFAVAETLAKAGYEVMAVDANEDIVQSIAGEVSYAMRADITETGVLESLGISNVDAVVVGIAENLEASIMATIYAKEVGVKYVMAKAENKLHATILKKVGADDIIFPEWSMGTRVAKNLMSGGFVDFFELSSKFSLAELPVPGEWVGKSLIELNLRDQYGVNVIGVKVGDDVQVNVKPDEVFRADQTLMIVGENDSLAKLQR